MSNGIDDLVFAGYSLVLKILKDFNASNLANDFAMNAMLSFGEALGGDITKSADRMLKLYNNMRADGYNNKILFDSGGFQVLVGRVKVSEIEELVKQYLQFINNVYKDDVYFMSLDIMTNNSSIKDTETSFKYSSLFLNEISNYSSEVQKKIYMVYQFTSPSMIQVWDRLINEFGVVEKLDSHKWAIGGLAASSQKRSAGSLIAYVYPLIDIIMNNELNYLLNGTDMYFHVLGITNPLDNIAGYIIQSILDKKYNIKMHYSYDSTSSFQTIIRAGKFITLTETGLHDISFKYRDRFDFVDNVPLNDWFVDKLNNLVNKYELATDHIESLYDGTKIANNAVKLLILLQTEEFLKLVSDIKNRAARIAECVDDDDLLYDAIVDTLKFYRGGMLTKNTLDRARSITNSILTLDNYINNPKSFNHTEYIQSIADLYSKFEPTTLNNQSNIPF